MRASSVGVTARNGRHSNMMQFKLCTSFFPRLEGSANRVQPPLSSREEGSDYLDCLVPSHAAACVGLSVRRLHAQCI